MIRIGNDKTEGDGEKDDLVLQDTFAQETAVMVEDPNMYVIDVLHFVSLFWLFFQYFFLVFSFSLTVLEKGLYLYIILHLKSVNRKCVVDLFTFMPCSDMSH